AGAIDDSSGASAGRFAGRNRLHRDLRYQIAQENFTTETQSHRERQGDQGEEDERERLRKSVNGAGFRRRLFVGAPGDP
ncbi:MAG: hypothetical protein ACREP2_08685, partial [Rhodanobacteraceae bacterium]